jgi:hypothetical protein
MALGGGTFTTQNKVLPGAYMNFVSLKAASASLSNRGIATIPLELDWGAENDVFEVTNTDFQKNSMKIFGYSYNHEKLKGLRDLFKNIQTLYAYRLNGGGTKASNTYATAKFGGVRGNDIKIVIQANVDGESLFDVKTYLDTIIVDTQTVSVASALVANDYVTFKTDATLEVTAGVSLSGGSNGTVDGTAHQTYLDKIESYSFNAIGVVATEDTIKSLYVNFCKRLRDEIGVKFQAVIYNKKADFEGVVNVKNKTTDTDWSEACLVYWVTGIVAGCAINKSNTNKAYDGEFTVDVNYTQTQLSKAIQDGEFTLHKVGSDIRVLEDINSLVTTTEDKGVVFKDNQTIRIIDQKANDIAVLFNTKYLGAIPNDAAGRISLWSDIVKQCELMQTIRAIENFTDADVSVEQGDDKKSVVVNDAIEPIGTMTKLYMTTVIR